MNSIIEQKNSVDAKYYKSCKDILNIIFGYGKVVYYNTLKIYLKTHFQKEREDIKYE